MVRVTVLGSGSRGNAIVVDGTRGTVLIDCGFAARTLHARLTAASRAPEEITAVLLTHEHVDHACGAGVASARWGWPVHATAATLAAVEPTTGRRPLHMIPITTAMHDVAGFSVSHCAVPHDAADCRAYVLTDEASGGRVGVVLDCGDVPDALPAFLAHCDLLVLESNHCPTMLTQGPYPWMLKQRIRGGYGHLSNAHAARVLREVAHAGLRGVMLAHLSETNNTPDLAVASAREALAQAGWHRGAIWAAPQRTPHAPIT